MIHWAWLILAFVVGGNVGLVIMAICAVASDAEGTLQNGKAVVE